MSYNATREIHLSDGAFVVTETDAKGKIVFANDEFCTLAEYCKEELIGKHHNIVRHPDMPKEAFDNLWETVKNGNVWSGYVKNKTKNGNFYWVFATVYPFKNDNGEQCYISCRRKPSRDMVEFYENHYASMR